MATVTPMTPKPVRDLDPCRPVLRSLRPELVLPSYPVTGGQARQVRPAQPLDPPTRDVRRA